MDDDRTGAILAQLVREGLVTPPTIPPAKLPPAPTGIMTLATLLAELDQQRADRSNLEPAGAPRR